MGKKRRVIHRDLLNPAAAAAELAMVCTIGTLLPLHQSKMNWYEVREGGKSLEWKHPHSWYKVWTQTAGPNRVWAVWAE